MRIIRCVVAAALLAASTAHAALISVTADIGWSCGTGSGGFEAGCTPNAEWGTMNFVYNTSVVDSDPSAAAGGYGGAIISFVMTVEQQDRADLFFTLASGPGSIAVGTANGDKSFSLLLTAAEHSGAYGLVNFQFNGYAVGLPLDDSIPSQSYWDRATAYIAWASGGGVVGVSETDWAWNFQAVTLVPTTDTLALLLAGAIPLAMAGFARQRVEYRRRSNS